MKFSNIVLAAAASGRLALSAGPECSAIEAALQSLAQTDCGRAYLDAQCGQATAAPTTTCETVAPNAPTTTTTKATTTTRTTSTTTRTTSSSSSSSTTEASGGSNEPFIGTYYPNWMVYSKIYMGVDKIATSSGSAATPEEKYTVWPSDSDNLLSKVNTLFYAFHNLDRDCYISDADTDASWYGDNGNSATWISMNGHATACKGAINDMMSLKSKYPHLRLMISVGGWTFSQNFSNCAKDSNNFKRMYDSFAYYTGGDFGKDGSMWAGLDFDWEHPASSAYTDDFDVAADWPNYAKLVKYFRDRANSEGRAQMLITSAVGAGETIDVLLKDAASAATFCQSLDYFNLMTYDLHGKWEDVTGHNAPFCQIDDSADARPAPRDLPWSVKDRIRAVVGMCGASKVAIGFPNYSPAWTGIPADNQGLYQKSTDSTSDPTSWARWSTFSDEDASYVPQGIIHYWDLKQSIDNSNYGLQVYTKTCPADLDVEVPVKWVYSSSKKIFASYEDTETVAKKAQWAKKLGLGGFFFWDMSQDTAGEILDAARSGWGVTTTHSAGGSKTCYDSSRPDFDLQPDGTESEYAGCHQSTRQTVVPAGQGCGAAAETAAAACNGATPIAVGGARSWGGSSCVNPCTRNWGNGSDVQANDIVYYVCEGEKLSEMIPDKNSSGNDSGNAAASDCYAWSTWNSVGSCAQCPAVSSSGKECTSFYSTPCWKTLAECQANPVA